MNKKTRKNKIGGVSFPVKPMEAGDMRLFPDEYSSGAASANECTGLVQAAPADDDVMDAYEELYSYRQPEPIVRKDDV